ncbi:TetR/AcrR family transcriptional regulator [Marinomonas posidonica]|uniref:TetR/AcrR family transcriptional regulator n=1 Tax=Marinomonas posidonica TaxID=936476 RepID=UPI003735F289
MTDSSTPVKRKRGRPSKITRQSIARAALEIGVNKATIPTLALHLGVDHSSLYHHVKSRDEIIAMAAEIAIEELEWRAPETVNWREELIVLTDSIWALYDKHPGLAEALNHAEIAPQNGILSFAESVKLLQEKGFPLDEAVVAVDMLVDMVKECFIGWWSIVKTEQDGRLRKERMIEIWETEAHNSPEQAEQINAMVNIMKTGPRTWWERKRDIALDGIAIARERRSLPMKES